MQQKIEDEKEKKITLIISDTHFGVRVNSLTWLREQTRVFDDQIIPYIESKKAEYNSIEFVHCGDLFDSRSSISPYILYHVVNLLKRLCALCDKVTIIGGNHDYYSPNESEYNINSLDMLPYIDNLYIVNEGYVRDGCNLFVPWFSFENRDTLKDIIHKERDVTNIFCHTDLERLDETTISLLSPYTVISGHIHKPWYKYNLYGIGSVFPLTFADANQDRYFYTMVNDDVKSLIWHSNESSIKFWRLYGEEILRWKDYGIKKMDQVELYIDKDDIDAKPYKEAISICNKEFNTKVISFNKENDDNPIIIDSNYDILKICENMIPKKLQKKFFELKSIIQKNGQ